MDYWQELLKTLEPSQTQSQPSKPKRPLNRYPLDPQKPSLYLTEQEARCVHHLLKSCTIKETGLLLKLSPRTVEFYLKRIRTKTNTRNKKELLEWIRRTDFTSSFKIESHTVH